MSGVAIEVAIDIAAALETVWDVLLDVEAYATWNPFIERVVAPPGGVRRPGTRLRLHVRFPDGWRVRVGEVVREVTLAGGHARWAYEFTHPLGRLGLISASRVQTLERLSEARTRYVSREDFGGVLFPVLRPLFPLEQVRIGFEQQAAALRGRCENHERTKRTRQLAEG